MGLFLGFRRGRNVCLLNKPYYVGRSARHSRVKFVSCLCMTRPQKNHLSDACSIPCPLYYIQVCAGITREVRPGSSLRRSRGVSWDRTCGLRPRYILEKSRPWITDRQGRYQGCRNAHFQLKSFFFSSAGPPGRPRPSGPRFVGSAQVPRSFCSARTQGSGIRTCRFWDHPG